jgi:Fe(3+) dicitrate transport protein
VTNRPGAATIITPEQIEERHPMSTDDMLRSVPGLHLLAEDGRGLRPNIGFRGLEPFRSRKTLLLADGVPIQPAVYGDPASYFNVPVELVDSIEVIRGASSVLYGPNTIGGVVNYVMRKPPEQQELRFKETARQGGFFTTELTYGNTWEKLGVLAGFVNKRGSTVRDNTGTDVNSVDVRLKVPTPNAGALNFGLQGYREIAQTPGGITAAQFRQDPNQSQRSHDKFFGNRAAFDLKWDQPLGADQALGMLFYSNWFERNWFIADGVDSANPTTNSQFLRSFYVVGLEPRFRWRNDWGRFVAGARVHFERMQDLQRAGSSADARSGTTRTEATNTTLALAPYFEANFDVTDRLTITPGIRFEHIRQNIKIGMRNGVATGVEGTATSNETVGGVGATYKLAHNTSVFANAFRTFSPPQFSQAVDPTTGTDRDLDAERGDNFEIGVRSRPTAWLSGELALFRINFNNQIITESGKLVNGGKTRHSGLEGMLKFGPWSGWHGDASITLLQTEFRSGVYQGNTLPSAPRQKYALGVTYRQGLSSVRLEGLYVGKQFTDAANTEAESADGKNGALPAYTVWNLRTEYAARSWKVFAGVDNLLNEKYRERRDAFFNGIVPGLTRTAYIGFSKNF